MIADARSISSDETLDTDVCIVGAGVAGLTLAQEFSKEEFGVLLLESGGLTAEADSQQLCGGLNIGHPYFPLETTRARYMAGSSNLWHIDLDDNKVGVRLRPLDDLDFESRDGIPNSGWPFPKSCLERFYSRSQSLFGITPESYKVEDWEDLNERPKLPFKSSSVETVIFKFGDRDIFTFDLRKKVAAASKVITLLHANALEIETNQAGRSVSRLKVSSTGREHFWVTSKLFILANGGIEVPRLMLLSNKSHRNGLGNGNDLVGRYFMEHLHYQSGVFVPSDRTLSKSTRLYASIHSKNEVPIIGKLSLSSDVKRSERLLNHTVQLMPKNLSIDFMHPPVNSGGVRSAAANASRGVLRNLKRMLYGKKIQVFRLANMTEQAPNPDSRITLADEKDVLGQRVAQLDWKLSDIDMISAKKTQRIIGRELDRSGLGRLYIQLDDDTPPDRLHGGYHHMGTTRMHPNPQYGVVDGQCRVHGISNLYVAGPSVFPTGGYANPVLTALALTFRLAEHLKSQIRNNIDALV